MTAPTLNPKFSRVYVFSVGVIVGAEALAISRRRTATNLSGQHGETVTQHWIWVDAVLDARSPFLGKGWRLATAAGCSWLTYHFLTAPARYNASLLPLHCEA